MTSVAGPVDSNRRGHGTSLSRVVTVVGLVALPLLLYIVMLQTFWDRGELSIDLTQTLLPAAHLIADGYSPYPAYGYPPLVAFALTPLTLVPSPELVWTAALLVMLAASLWVLRVRDWRVTAPPSSGAPPSTPFRPETSRSPCCSSPRSPGERVRPRSRRRLERARRRHEDHLLAARRVARVDETLQRRRRLRHCRRRGDVRSVGPARLLGPARLPVEPRQARDRANRLELYGARAPGGPRRTPARAGGVVRARPPRARGCVWRVAAETIGSPFLSPYWPAWSRHRSSGSTRSCCCSRRSRCTDHVSVVWVVPALLWFGSGNGNGRPWQTALVLGVGAATFALAVLRAADGAGLAPGLARTRPSGSTSACGPRAPSVSLPHRGERSEASRSGGRSPYNEGGKHSMTALVVYLQNTWARLRDREGQTMAEYALILGRHRDPRHRRDPDPRPGRSVTSSRTRAARSRTSRPRNGRSMQTGGGLAGRHDSPARPPPVVY